MAKSRHDRNQTFKKPATLNTVIIVIIADIEYNLQKAAIKLIK